MLTLHSLPPLLDGLIVRSPENAGLPINVCAEHLALLGAGWEPELSSTGRASREPYPAGELVLRPKPGRGAFASMDESVDCTIWWPSPCQGEPKLLGSEVIVQALSGLMAVHGKDQHAPRRLGLDVASVAAGIVATQGVLAALIAARRGHNIRGVQTSVLQAALLFLYHHLAIATCDDEFSFPSTGAAPGPPFCTADGHWVELEILSGASWFAFWSQLGVERSEVGAAWLPFVYRYLAGRCALPAALHEATKRHTLTELRAAADTCGVAICRVRSYPELLAELGWPAEDNRHRVGVDPRVRAPWTIAPGSHLAGRYCASLRPHTGAPLAGLRVVEVTSRLQGPLAGLLLRMLGADVIKVEPPGGDFGRHAAPLAGSLGAAYLAYNRRKQVVEIDYKRPEGRAQLADLVAGADVFLHNWRSGRAEQLGFDFESLVKLNPKLVYAHASGWGRTSDEPSPIAGDYLVQAYAGCGDGLNSSDEPPFPSRVTLVDVTGGLLACEGILAGLYQRERSGQGCRVDTSLFAGAMVLQANVLKAISAEHESGRRLGRPLWGILDQPIETADGFLIVSVKDEQARKRLLEVCGLRASAREEQIAERLRSRPAAEWESLLLAAGVPAGVVQGDLSSLPYNPYTAALLERVEDACWVPAAPWQFKI